MTLAPTRLTRLLGVAHPVLGGGLMWLSDARYVAGLVNAGVMAYLTPRSFDTGAAYIAQLQACAELTQGKAFGVNLSLSKRPDRNHDVMRQLDIAIDHGVRHYETVGPRPEALFARIHAAGGVVIHKCASIEHAVKAEAQGADAIALVGMEAGGHPGMNRQPASVLCAYALDRLRVPLALGGGIGHGRQIAAALALGCEGVVIGTRFLVCDEIWAHAHYKQRLVDSGAEDSTVVLRSLGDSWRVLDNATAREVARLEASGVDDHAGFGELVLGRTGRDHAYQRGDVERGLLSMGPSIGFADRREPVADIVSRLMQQAADAFVRLAAQAAASVGDRA